MSRLLLVCLLLTAATTAAEEIYPGYTWQDLGEGVYLHSRNDPFAGPVDGNVIVIVNDAAVYVVDTHIDPAAARAVIGKIGKITDNPVTHVVNTHWHDDHTNGNHAFRDAYPDAKIVAHSATLAALRKEWGEMEDQRRTAYAPVTAEKILAAAEQLAASDPEKAIGYRIYAGYVAALKPELPTLKLVYPDTVFEDRLVLDADGRTVILEWLGRGNTDGDIVVWLPDDRLLITGDLLVAPIPYAFDSPMLDWIETLSKLANKHATTIIPGHGAVQRDSDYLLQVKTLLQDTVDAVDKAQSAGTPYAELTESIDLSRHERRFTHDEIWHRQAWNAYYLAPGIKSAWVALGFAVPQEQ